MFRLFITLLAFGSITSAQEPSLADAIKHLHPSADFVSKVIIGKSSGQPERIERWDVTLGVQPTPEQIAAAKEAVRAARAAEAQAEQQGKERLDAIIAKLQGGQPLTAPERIAFDLSVAKAIKALAENPRGNGQGQANKPQ